MADDLEALAADLDRAARTITKRARGAGAKAVDAVMTTAQQNALGSWTKLGRGMAGSAGTIRGRMSADRSTVAGYVMAEGPGVHQSEYGTASRPPVAVMGPALDQHAAFWASKIEDAGADLL